MKFSGPKNNKSQNIKFYETPAFPIFTIFFIILYKKLRVVLSFLTEFQLLIRR